jgi:AcrR family transcriptional regulator
MATAGNAGRAGGPRRATFERSRSVQTKRALVLAATSLWRVNGYDRTAVADICQAAGVSKGLFYFYFERKDDLLYEIGLFSYASVARQADRLLKGDYEVVAVMRSMLESFERDMRRNPGEIVVRAILEGYRRLAQDRDRYDQPPPMLQVVLERAVRDGKLPAHFDVTGMARMSQIVISEGARVWASGLSDNPSFADEVLYQLVVMLRGAAQEPSAPLNGGVTRKARVSRAPRRA